MLQMAPHISSAAFAPAQGSRAVPRSLAAPPSSSAHPAEALVAEALTLSEMIHGATRTGESTERQVLPLDPRGKSSETVSCQIL